jgi:hypothetical protein
LALLGCAAFLESAFGICLGCMTFGLLIRAGVVPEEVCARCNDIWSTASKPTSTTSSSMPHVA